MDKNEEIITRFKSVHGDKYWYSNVRYNKMSENVTITCPIHGDFKQLPKNHLKGCGCPKCSNVYRKTTKEWITEAQKIHNGKYDYSKTEYNGGHEKVCIICPEHGEFWQLANNHLKGEGCIKCRNDKMSSDRSMGLEGFIYRAKEAHGDKYDYSKVEYTNNNTKVCIICPEHGEFWQQPNNHINGQGCPVCYKERPRKEKTKNPEKDKGILFLEKAAKIHNNKYDYSKVNYKNAHTKVCIICPEHGEFWQAPCKHIIGQGCPECAKTNGNAKGRLTCEEFISKSISKHGKKYDYTKVDYVNNSTKVCIICPEHGEFWQTPASHMNGNGCPECAKVSRIKKQTHTNNDFIQMARQIYRDKYDYSRVEYINNTTPVIIICHKKYANGKEHGEFTVSPNKFLGRGTECPKCSDKVSKPEISIYDFICGLVGKENVKRSDRKTLNGHEIDIYIPKLKIGFEYNGLFWHSDAVDRNTPSSHLAKTEACEKLGIHLVQIFGDEYNYHRELVLEKIRHILGCDNKKPKIMARKCTVCEIEWRKAKDFLNKFHLQGQANATVSLGCYHEKKLIGVMTFLKDNHGGYELNRFATDTGFACLGVGGKMLKYFIMKYKPKTIKSFADRRWSTTLKPNLYDKLGFKLEKTTSPKYSYIDKNKPSKRMHRFNFRKQALHRKYGYPMDMTESAMTKAMGLSRVYDCGMLKYIMSFNCE